MPYLIGFSFPRQPDPTAMKIGGFGADPGINQHLRGLYVGRLDRNSVTDRTDAGEHLAANFPCVVAATPRVGKFGTGQVCAYGIDVITGHGGQTAAEGAKTQGLAQNRSRARQSA